MKVKISLFPSFTQSRWQTGQNRARPMAPAGFPLNDPLAFLSAALLQLPSGGDLPWAGPLTI
jgi:hypothetical protein